jgi:hypothetical protein
MQNRRRYRFHDEPINMHHPHRAADCSCATKPKSKSVTVTPLPDDDYATLAQQARRRPITLAMMNKLNRAFWRTR